MPNYELMSNEERARTMSVAAYEELAWYETSKGIGFITRLKDVVVGGSYWAGELRGVGFRGRVVHDDTPIEDWHRVKVVEVYNGTVVFS